MSHDVTGVICVPKVTGQPRSARGANPAYCSPHEPVAL